MLKRAPHPHAALADSGEFLCRMLASSRSGVLVLDPHLVVVAHNPTGQALLASQFSPLPEELARAARSVLSGGAAHQLELGFARGSWDVECLPFESGVIVVVHDAGERQALRRQLERTSRTELLGKLSGSIAHDFNNLLTGMRGSLALARQNRSEESRDAALQAADLAAQRAGEMTRQLLAYGRGPVYVAPRADVRSVLNEAAGLLSCLPDGARVEVDLDDELGRVDTSPAELHQIVLNLLMNARDAVKPMGPRGRVSLTAGRRPGRLGDDDGREGPTSRKRPVRWLRVTVSDNGQGMDAATQQRIFEPFFTTKPGHEGTGLGLSNVRTIVERAGGWIDVQSRPQEGATFDVYLPLVGEDSDMNLEEAGPSPLKQVLICDDEARLASLTAGLLKEFGYDTMTVGAGEEALELLRSSADFGVLLLDVNLAAGVSASEILRTMKDEGLASPVILTSGFAPEDIPDSLRRHDCVASYLPKPYTVTELVAAIRRALDRPSNGWHGG